MNNCSVFNCDDVVAEPTTEGIHGKWIWNDGQVTPGQWVCFRKKFNLSAVSDEVIVNIAVDSKYWLWVNGRMILFEGQVKNGPTTKGIYYDTLNISKYLVAGENVISVLAVYFGKNGYGFFDSGTAGLLFEARMGDGFKIVSDETWKAVVNPAYHVPVLQKDKSYRLAEPDINYYADDELGDWTGLLFNDSCWKNTVAHNRPFDELWKRPIPQLDVKPITYFREKSSNHCWKCKNKSNEQGILVYTITNDTNVQGTPYLKVIAPEGERINIFTDTWKEMANNGDSVRHSYVTKAGLQEFEALGWVNGYHVYFEIPENIQVLELGFRKSSYRIDKKGEFKCNDTFINTLVKKSYDTLLVTMRDTFMDCPDRERAQWIGDAVNEMQMAFYSMDKNAGLLFKKAMNQALNFRHISGVLPSTVPNGLEYGEILDADGNLTVDAKKRNLTQCFELPMQSLALTHSFWQYYMFSGDKQPLKDGLPALLKYLRLWSFSEKNGVIEHRHGTWDWDDWGENSDTMIIDQCWYYIACKNTLKVLHELSDVHQQYEAFLLNRMKAIKAHFEDNFWNQSRHAYYHSTMDGQADDRANALAVYAGLYTNTHKADLIELLTVRQESSPYMEKYVMEALYELDANKEAIGRMKDRYHEMVSDPFPTLWEFWKMSAGTRNHAWTGGPLTMAYKYNLGITPMKPGYQTLQIRPHLGGLTNIQGNVQSVRGTISVEVLNQEKSSISIVTPKSIRLTQVCIPKELIKKNIVINGQPVYRQSKITDLPGKIDFVKDEEKYLTFNVSGDTTIKVVCQ